MIRDGPALRWVQIALAATLVAAVMLVSAMAKDGDGGIPDIAFFDPQRLVFGEWHYHDGHNPVWANPDLNDEDWPRVENLGASQPMSATDRWYRMRFTIGWHYRTRSLGVFLGALRQSHEVYINGRRLGGEGSFDESFVDGARKNGVYTIPTLGLWYSFLSFSRANVIAVRVQAVSQPLRFDTTQVQIDDFDKLILIARESDTSKKIFQGAAVSILLFIALFCSFLFVSGFRGQSNVIFGSFVLLAAVSIFLDSLLFFDLGLKSSFTQRLTHVAEILCVIAFARLAYNALFKRQTLIDPVLEGVAIFLCILWVFDAPSIDKHNLFLALSVAGLALLLNVWVRSVFSLREARQDALAIVAITSAMMAAWIYALMVVEPDIPMNAFHFSLAAAAFTLLYPIARQFQDMTRHLSVLSERLVSVRDLERARLARDMHDGVGQSLAAIGLHLKILSANKKDEASAHLTRAVDDLTCALGEVIQNLRPSNLAGRSFSSAITQHLRRTLKGTEISPILGKLDDVALKDDVKEQAFRICQEALNNAIRHAECTTVGYDQRLKGRYLRLTINDNGKGFKPREQRGKGLGLSTMRERASLINGALSVVSSPGQGTQVILEITLND